VGFAARPSGSYGKCGLHCGGWSSCVPRLAEACSCLASVSIELPLSPGACYPQRMPLSCLYPFMYPRLRRCSVHPPRHTGSSGQRKGWQPALRTPVERTCILLVKGSKYSGQDGLMKVFGSCIQRSSIPPPGSGWSSQGLSTSCPRWAIAQPAAEASSISRRTAHLSPTAAAWARASERDKCPATSAPGAGIASAVAALEARRNNAVWPGGHSCQKLGNNEFGKARRKAVQGPAAAA
jgi:hypothetical protein